MDTWQVWLLSNMFMYIFPVLSICLNECPSWISVQAFVKYLYQAGRVRVKVCLIFRFSHWNLELFWRYVIFCSSRLWSVYAACVLFCLCFLFCWGFFWLFVFFCFELWMLQLVVWIYHLGLVSDYFIFVDNRMSLLHTRRL